MKKVVKVTRAPTLDVEEMLQTAVRLPAELIRRIDEVVPKLQKELAGVKVNRSVAIRVLLSRGLEGFEGAGAAKA